MAVKDQVAPSKVRKCGAKTRSGGGGPCGRPAGWGTEHLGTGHCKFHGGATPNGGLHAAREEVVIMGYKPPDMATGIDVSPQEALLTCVRLAAGHVAYATDKVAELQREEVIGRLKESSERSFVNDDGDDVTYREVRDKGPDLHVWIRVQQESMDRLARFSKMAIDAGVEERKVAIAERWVELLTGVLSGILDDLKLTPAQRKLAPQVVGARLSALEAGALG